MENTKKLLDDVKNKNGLTSDNALAALLGVRRQRVSDYYKGARSPDNTVCKRIADTLNQPLNTIIALIEIDAAKNENDKKEWISYLKRIGGLAASILVCVSFLLTPTPAKASDSKDSDLTNLYYVK